MKPMLPGNRYLVDKMFFSKEIATYRSICIVCGAYVSTYTHKDAEKTCSECGTVIKLHDSNNISFYVTYSIENEIKNILESNDAYYDRIVNLGDH